MVRHNWRYTAIIWYYHLASIETSYISYLITDLVSISFEATTASIWPSDEQPILIMKLMIIQYDDTEYIVYFESDSLKQQIKHQLKLNFDGLDTCLICNELGYECYDCNFGIHFNISLVADANLDAIRFDITDPSNTTGYDILVLPSELIIPLKKCVMTIEPFAEVISSPYVHFLYNLSSTCHEKYDLYLLTISGDKMIPIGTSLIIRSVKSDKKMIMNACYVQKIAIVKNVSMILLKSQLKDGLIFKFQS